MTETTVPELIVETRGSLGILILNRPKVLNSLSLAMVRMMEEVLDRFAADPAIRAVLMKGAGDRAFCAGGDIRALYEAGKAGDPLPETFWREEYRLDERISRFEKPVIAVMNGITMGGGVGLAAHCRHRITTEITKFAMPEAGIGFFPDVGASWLLTRKPGFFGTYLALTGTACGAGDTILAGMADLFVPAARLQDLETGLQMLADDADGDAVGRVVSARGETITPEMPPERLSLIDRCFGAERMEDILDALSRETDPFAAETLAQLSTKSPTSLKVTLALYRQGRVAPDLRTCLEREFAVTAGMIAGHDFYEGVRAAIIDKDRNPQWAPADLSGVSDGAVAQYFEPRQAPLF